jgi:LysM repeat protein
MPNPFSAPTAYQADQQKLRRERVKITFYAIVGTMVVFCLALLFQGCQHHEPAAENPITPLPLTQVSSDLPAIAGVPDPVVSSNFEAVPPPAPTIVEQAPAVSAPVISSTPDAKPITDAPEPTPAETLYVVKRGDSLSAIARANRTTVKALKVANGLTSDRIQIGKTLKIPASNS